MSSFGVEGNSFLYVDGKSEGSLTKSVRGIGLDMNVNDSVIMCRIHWMDGFLSVLRKKGL